MLDEAALARVGYDAEDLRFLRQRDDKGLRIVGDIRRILDRFGYLHEWRQDYQIRSVRASLRADRITCIDAAVLAYGLLDWFPEVQRRVLAIHRRDAAGEECGHCVTLYWGKDGKVGRSVSPTSPVLATAIRCSPTTWPWPRAMRAATSRWGSLRCTSA
jgi:hypothetical protein